MSATTNRHHTMMNHHHQPLSSSSSNNSTRSTVHNGQRSSDGGSDKSPADLESFVDELIGQMNSEFKAVGEKIMERMNDMEGRFVELEHSIVLLLDQAGLNDTSHNHTDSPVSVAVTNTSRSPNGNSTTSNSSTVPSLRVIGTTATSPISTGIKKSLRMLSSSLSPKSVSGGASSTSKFANTVVSVAI